MTLEGHLWAQLRLREEAPTLVTRDQGDRVRLKLFSLLKTHAGVEVILDGVLAYTPSFMDELLGKTLQAIGKAEFKRRIKLRAESAEVRHLANLVLSNRASQPDRTMPH